MYERNPLTGTILQVLTEELTGGRVIYRTYGATRSFESLLVNRYLPYRKAIPFVARCLRRVYEHGPAGLRPEAEAPAHTRRLIVSLATARCCYSSCASHARCSVSGYRIGWASRPIIGFSLLRAELRRTSSSPAKSQPYIHHRVGFGPIR